MKARIALVVSHPIQHFCPQYVSFAENKQVVFKVFFASTLGLQKYMDPNFQREISWGNLNLDKFDHVFLNGEQLLKSDKNVDAPSLDEELNIFAPSVVIIYGYFQKLQQRAYQWALKNEIKLAYISDSELRQSRNLLKKWMQFFFLKRFFSRIDFFLSVGDANEAFYKNYGVAPSKLLRMHFPIDINAYELAFDNRTVLRSQVRAKYGVSAHSIVLSVVGKLVSWKNQDHIFDALRVLESSGISLELFVIGSGSMLNEWKTKADTLSCKVHFTGFVSIEELPSYYAATDIYIHPAAVEPHSIAISEAVFMGCPVVLSSTCGSYGETDDVKENENGYVYPFGDVEALAEKIKSLIDAPLKMSDFSMKSILRSRKFQQRAHKDALIELSSRLIDSHS